MKKIEVFFDYTCPFCYIGLTRFQKVLKDYPEVELIYRACEAHPYPEERMKMEDMEDFWKQVLIPEAAQVGLTLNNTYSPIPYSRLAFQGMQSIIDQKGNVEQYHRNVFHAVFVLGENIEDPKVLLSCAKETGVDLKLFEEALASDHYKDVQEATTRYAYLEKNIQTVPTLICDAEKLEAVAGVGLTEASIAEFLKKVNE